MAFNIENATSLRLNKIPAGAGVVIVDYARKKALATLPHGAVFVGFFDAEGNAMAAPSVMKAAPQGTVMRFVHTVTGEDNTTTDETVTFTKDPAGYGCFGYTDEAGKWKRITVYAGESVMQTVATIKAEADAAKLAAQKAKADAEAKAPEAPTEKKASKGKGRKAKETEAVAEPEAEAEAVTEA